MFQNLDANRASNLLSCGYRLVPSARIPCGSDCCVRGPLTAGSASGRAVSRERLAHPRPASRPTEVGPSPASVAHYGKHTPGNADLDGSLAQLDAITIALPDRLCTMSARSDPAPDRRATAYGLPLPIGGSACVGASPELYRSRSPVSTVDARHTNTPPGEAARSRRGQVRAAPSGFWKNLEAFENLRDAQGTDEFSGLHVRRSTTEQQGSASSTPTIRRHSLGPSSTCMRGVRLLGPRGTPAGPYVRRGSAARATGRKLREASAREPGCDRFDLSYRGRWSPRALPVHEHRADEHPVPTIRPCSSGTHAGRRLVRVDDVRITERWARRLRPSPSTAPRRRQAMGTGTGSRPAPTARASGSGRVERPEIPRSTRRIVSDDAHVDSSGAPGASALSYDVLRATIP